MTQSYTVVGMSCSHCALSVREEVSAIPGVRDVDVDLNTGHLVISGEGFGEGAVKRAVENAGYQLAGQP